LLPTLALVLGGATAWAQVPALSLPQASPAASVTQDVGLSQISVSYHRPAINKRAVWGGLVPYDQVWRAGANENTTITFSSAVKVGGKDLAAGTYGLHMIPTAKTWTVAFSKVSSAWGSFSYDEKEDALRVTVTPRTSAAFQERLLYTLDDPTETSVTLTLRWEKLEVPIAIAVDTPEVVRAHVRGELRGLPRFNWQPWNAAARYWLATGGSVDEALGFADRSVKMNENYQNVMTRAMLLDKKGDAAGARAARAVAAGIATEVDINAEGYQLLGQGKVDEALALFQKNVKTYPKSWNTHDSLAEALLAKGDKKGAAASYGKALGMVKDDAQKKRIQGVLAGLEEAK
jgi:hypothetical protein